MEVRGVSLLFKAAEYWIKIMTDFWHASMSEVLKPLIRNSCTSSLWFTKKKSKR